MGACPNLGSTTDQIHQIQERESCFWVATKPVIVDEFSASQARPEAGEVYVSVTVNSSSHTHFAHRTHVDKKSEQEVQVIDST